MPEAPAAACRDRPVALIGDHAPVERVAARYGMQLTRVADGADIPGSYWGAPEAGLVGARLFVRADTPVHSALHELGHYVCMTPVRRARLERDAGGDPDEECAVCYLQVVLAAELPSFGRERMQDDMDAWGYSFREGNVRRWLAGDGADARAWLARHGLIDAHDRPTFRLRALRVEKGSDRFSGLPENRSDPF